METDSSHQEIYKPDFEEIAEGISDNWKADLKEIMEIHRILTREYEKILNGLSSEYNTRKEKLIRDFNILINAKCEDLMYLTESLPQKGYRAVFFVCYGSFEFAFLALAKMLMKELKSAIHELIPASLRFVMSDVEIREINDVRGLSNKWPEAKLVDDPDWERVNALRHIRNCLIHNRGNLNKLKMNGDRRNVESYINKNSTQIRLRSDVLIQLEPDFIDTYSNDLNKAIVALKTSVVAAYESLQM